MSVLPESDPSRKIIARTRGELQHPASCACCGNSDPERTYIDWGIWYDYEGNVYICNLCFDEAAVKVMGYFSSQEHLELLAKNNNLMEKANELKAEVDKYENLGKLVRDLGAAVSPSISLSGGGPDLGTTEDAEGSEEGPQGDDVIREEGEPETPESSNGEGPTDVTRTEPRNRSKPVIQ